MEKAVLSKTIKRGGKVAAKLSARSLLRLARGIETGAVSAGTSRKGESKAVVGRLIIKTS